jgi:hypothetical protein
LIVASKLRARSENSALSVCDFGDSMKL